MLKMELRLIIIIGLQFFVLKMWRVLFPSTLLLFGAEQFITCETNMTLLILALKCDSMYIVCIQNRFNIFYVVLLTIIRV